MLKFDHIALVAETLEEGRAYAEEALGVPMQPGGKHAHFGTHNVLLGLGPELYFEVIAKDPDAPATGRPTWFGLDHFKGQPKLGNWICTADDYAEVIAQAPDEVGQPIALARDDITWHLTVPEDGSLPFGGAYPTLLQWGAGVTPPPAKLPDQGVRLLKWTVSHPDAERIRDIVPIADDRVEWNTGPMGFEAEFDTPNGHKVLR